MWGSVSVWCVCVMQRFERVERGEDAGWERGETVHAEISHAVNAMTTKKGDGVAAAGTGY